MPLLSKSSIRKAIYSGPAPPGIRPYRLQPAQASGGHERSRELGKAVMDDKLSMKTQRLNSLNSNLKS